MNTINSNGKFSLGDVVITPAALEATQHHEVLNALARHVRGDWGDVSAEDRSENELSLREGFRLMSVYRSSRGETFWIITEADRSATTILLPQDY
jgi:hypothetical protein